MTDNEIIKALECCRDLKCSECPKKTNFFIDDCDVQLCDEAVDLINRQKAEIEMLEARLEGVQDANAILRERNEIAIAKVIRRYKEKVEQTLKSKGFWLVIIKNVLNDIEREMVGDTE